MIFSTNGAEIYILKNKTKYRTMLDKRLIRTPKKRTYFSVDFHSPEAPSHLFLALNMTQQHETSHLPMRVQASRILSVFLYVLFMSTGI